MARHAHVSVHGTGVALGGLWRRPEAYGREKVIPSPFRP